MLDLDPPIPLGDRGCKHLRFPGLALSVNLNDRQGSGADIRNGGSLSRNGMRLSWHFRDPVMTHS
jgi:hypothetical protein